MATVNVSPSVWAGGSPAIQFRFSRFRGTVQHGPARRQETQIVQPCKTLGDFLPGFWPQAIRLNIVSQLAGFAKRHDLAYFLREICDVDYVHVPSLAPTKEILDAYRKRRGTWGQYEERFMALMARRRIEDVVDPALLDGACLLCGEHRPHYCHRRLVAEYLRAQWGGIEIEHLVTGGR